MSSSLSVDADVLLSLPIGVAIAESDKQECWYFGQVFSARAKEAGETQTASAWALLSALAQAMLQAGDRSEPFRASLEMPGWRTLVPTDLDDPTAAAVHALAKQVSDPELRARLMDITWDARRDHLAARDAIRSYLQSAARLMDPEHWPPYVDRCERALRLATQIRDDELQASVLVEIEDRVLELDGTDTMFMTNRLMELLIEFDRGDPEKMCVIAEKGASMAEGREEFDKARSHLENLVRWSRMAKNEEAERGAKIRIAASYERQAELCSDDGEFLLVAHWLERAHECYRGISGLREKTNEVYRRLLKSQRRGLDEMEEVSTGPTDITEYIVQTRKHVSRLTFRRALLALATVAKPTNYDSVTQQARELMEEFPLQGLFGGVIMGDDGRVVARRSSASPGDKDQEEQALWERVAENVIELKRFEVQTAVAPALNQIMFEHNPELRDLRDLVVHNPFVPDGHEELFARGFLAGLRGDFPEALSILIPQMENSLRHLLKQSGLEVSRVVEGGYQDAILLGSILGKERLEEILGADIVKDIKVLFHDRQGPQLRHYIAHGLFKHRDFNSPLAIYAWWFIFYLCICPVQKRFEDEPESSEEED